MPIPSTEPGKRPRWPTAVFKCVGNQGHALNCTWTHEGKDQTSWELELDPCGLSSAMIPRSHGLVLSWSIKDLFEKPPKENETLHSILHLVKKWNFLLLT